MHGNEQQNTNRTCALWDYVYGVIAITRILLRMLLKMNNFRVNNERLYKTNEPGFNCCNAGIS